MNGELEHADLTLVRLVQILEGEKQIRVIKAMRAAERKSPIKSSPTTIGKWVYTVTPEIEEILYEPPFPLILHKDPPRPTGPLEDLKVMISAAQVICTRNLEYLKNLQAELEAQVA